MGRTNAERQQEYRKRLKKDGKYGEYKAKQKTYRENQNKKRAQLLTEMNDYDREEAINKLRQKKKSARHSRYEESKKKQTRPLLTIHNPYVRIQDEAKDMKRVKKALPLNKDKAIYLCKNILTELTGNKIEAIHNNKNKKLLEQVEQFFREDSISQVSPRLRDVKKFMIDGVSLSLSKRTMLYSYSEAYQLFKQKHPDVKCSFTSFFGYKPPEIKSFTLQEHNVCVCELHANMDMALQALCKAEGIELNDGNYPSFFLCSECSENCFFNKCSLCKDDKILKTKIDASNLDYDLTWQQWQTQKDQTSYSRVKKSTIEGTAIDLYEWVVKNRAKYTEHVYIKRNQSRYFKDLIKTTEADGENCLKLAVIQVDFAENFICRDQNSTQQANFGYDQISVFTSVTWHCGEKKSTVIVSDYKKHDKESVLTFLNLIMKTLPTTVQEVEIFSDNATSQFKNKYIFASLKSLGNLNAIDIKWNFLASQHGKGACDGVGAFVKEYVWRKIKCNRISVRNAKDFHDAASCSNIFVINCTEDEIKRFIKNNGFDKAFCTAKNVPNIMSHHRFIYEETKLKVYKISPLQWKNNLYP